MHQVELKSGETYRGELHEAEDNWNCQLKNITATAKVSVLTLFQQYRPLNLASFSNMSLHSSQHDVYAGWEDITFRAHLYQRQSNQVTNHSGVVSPLQLRSCEIIIVMMMNCKQCML